MQGDVGNLTAEYQGKMDALFKEHEKRMALAQKAFEAAVAAGSKQLQEIISESSPVEKKEAALAVWSKTPSGEDCLILNREAAIMQMALLDQLADVLQELSKLSPRR